MEDPNLEKAKKIIEENLYITIATATKDGKPWISPVFFRYDKTYNLFWVSNKNALHSKLIRENPQVAIVIFDSSVPEGQGNGVYFEANSHELENESEIKHAMKILDKRVTKDEFRVKGIGQVTTESVWRIYRAVPEKVWVSGSELINGHPVDTRVEVDLLK